MALNIRSDNGVAWKMDSAAMMRRTVEIGLLKKIIQLPPLIIKD